LEDLLSEHEAVFWAAKISRVKEVAKKSDEYCIVLFEGLFGGMGSLNDLVLNAPASVNDKLHKELGRAYSVAMSLK
jgi:Domain of unknown function (DUF6966)